MMKHVHLKSKRTRKKRPDCGPTANAISGRSLAPNSSLPKADTRNSFLSAS